MKVLIKQNDTTELWVNGVLLTKDTVPDKHGFILEIQDKDIFREETFRYSSLDSILNSLLNLSNNYSIYYKPDVDARKRYLVEVELLVKSEKVLTITQSWTKEPFKLSRGRSSYRDVNYYMPKWSTAYKNEWSSHSKFAEPLFSNLEYLKKASKIHLQSNYEEDHYSYIVEEKVLMPRIHRDKGLSTYSNRFIYSQYVRVYDEIDLDFGYDFNTLMIRAIDPLDYAFELVIEGEYKHQPISETLIIDSNGIFKPKKRYNKVTYIGLGSLNIEYIDPENIYLEIGNKLDLAGFSYEDRKDTILELNGNHIQIRTKDHLRRLLQTFSLPISVAEFIYIDSNDNVYLRNNGILYTGKLDAKIDLQIEEDMTYNNIKFIETCYMSPGEYISELYLNDFQQHTGSDLIAIRLIDNSGTKYLDEGLDFVYSDTALYISRSIINLYPKLSLDLDLKYSDFVSISLIDYTNTIKVSNLVVNPIISLKPEDSLEQEFKLVFNENYPESPEYQSESFHLINCKPTAKVYLKSPYVNTVYVDLFGQIPIEGITVPSYNNYNEISLRQPREYSEDYEW